MSGNRCWGSPFTDTEITDAKDNGKLLTMELELSRICNLKCIYCYAESGSQLANELSFDEIVNALDQGVELGVRKIIVLGGGEPLAYPRIMDVLRAIRERNLEIELFTNGTLLTQEIVEELKRLEVNPVIKFNSLRPEIQDHLAGKVGAFESIQKGLELLQKAGYPNDTLSLGAQTVICQPNYDELPTMWRWLRSKDIIPYFETITEQGRAKQHGDLVVTPSKLQQLFDKLSQIDRDEFGIEWEPKPPVAAFTCQRHLYSCTVTSLGDIIPCPGVDIPAGNIRQMTIKDIIAKSDVFKNLRNIRETIKGKCKDCDLSNECYGCRGMAYHHTGDYLASDPLCWRNTPVQTMQLPLPACKVIPHRDSMLLIDTLVTSMQGQGRAETTRPATCIASEASSVLTPLIFVELIAQTYAAVKGWEIAQAGKEFPIGYLVGVQKFEILKPAHAGDRLVIDVSTVGEFEGFAIVAGTILNKDEILATGKIKLWVPQGEGE
ncbi:MAG: radical SAM protein [Pseudodesulfovibrio sp.]|nr:radical SAM protein [Pseudodesulfovibrio sp.]